LTLSSDLSRSTVEPSAPPAPLGNSKPVHIPRCPLSAKPVKPAYPPGVKPACPSSQPACPATQPACPSAQPACPSAQPACPSAQPACPSAQPACPVVPQAVFHVLPSPSAKTAESESVCLLPPTEEAIAQSVIKTSASPVKTPASSELSFVNSIKKAVLGFFGSPTLQPTSFSLPTSSSLPISTALQAPATFQTIGLDYSVDFQQYPTLIIPLSRSSTA